MIYAKVDTTTKEVLEFPIDPRNVREWALSNNISVPDDLALADLTPWGWYQVDWVELPKPSQPDHKMILDTPTWDGDKLIRTFKEVPRTAEETEELWQKVRQKRNKLLEESDWVELPSVVRQRTKEWQLQWKDYRNTLRDITEGTDPLMIEWPKIPEFHNMDE